VVWLKGIGRAVPLALLVMAVGCERFTGHAVRDWSEDVPLEDGRTVVVDRHVDQLRHVESLVRATTEVLGVSVERRYVVRGPDF